MTKRTPFSRIFWIANSIEVFERFAYYGIYMMFGIYLTHLGYSMDQLGIIQTIFLAFSYLIPVFSGTLADKYGFKKMLIISYITYLPSILLLIIAKSFSGIALTMLCIGLAAGIFKPLISATIRTVTDKTNKTLGFGIFYQMVNIGGFFGPLVAGKLRAISWDLAFYISAFYVVIMLLITIFFYREPERKKIDITIGNKLKEILTTLADKKFSLLLILLGLFFWLPFWAFFNLIALYVDKFLDTAKLYLSIKSVLGTNIANFFSKEATDGTRRILGEMIANSGIFIILFQIFVSKLFEKVNAMKAFTVGLFVVFSGYLVIALSKTANPSFIFLGIGLFAVGEMIASPRIQEYITWIAPKEKAGLYMGSNFLAIALGSVLSGVIYTSIVFKYFVKISRPELTWIVLAGHIIIGIFVFIIYTKTSGGLKELDS
jgi:dipeptide/tripeptide permease